MKDLIVTGSSRFIGDLYANDVTIEDITINASKTKNYVLAAPSAAAGSPTFRALVADDIPNLNTSKLTAGTLGVARGGTGHSSWTANTLIYASDASTLQGLGFGTNGYVLQSTGNNSAPGWTEATSANNVNAIVQRDSNGDFSARNITANVLYGIATSAIKLDEGAKIDHVLFTGESDIEHYFTCSTAAATAAKTVSASGFTLSSGVRIFVKFTNTNTVNNPTLNVNSTGAKAIYYNGVRVIYQGLVNNFVYDLMYDGTQWQVKNCIPLASCTSATAVGTVAKTATCPGFVLYTGARVTIAFTNGNSAAAPTLNVNSTGAKAIKRMSNGTVANLAAAGDIVANQYYDFIYDGTYWIMINATTSSSSVRNKIFYGTCSTAAATAAKAVTCPEFTSADLVAGAIIFVTFTVTNTADPLNLTLNVNSTGAKALYQINGANYTPYKKDTFLHANHTIKFAYDGTRWLGDLVIDSYANSSTQSTVYFGICSTAAGTAAKVVECNDFALSDGATILVNFSVRNSATLSDLTMNVNNTGAKEIRERDSNGSPVALKSNLNNATYIFSYNTSTGYWILNNGSTEIVTNITNNNYNEFITDITNTPEKVELFKEQLKMPKIGTFVIPVAGWTKTTENSITCYRYSYSVTGVSASDNVIVMFSPDPISRYISATELNNARTDWENKIMSYDTYDGGIKLECWDVPSNTKPSNVLQVQYIVY